MPKKTGIAIVAVGAVLILSALLLFFHNRQEDVQAGKEAESLLADVEAVIAAQAAEAPATNAPDESEDAALPSPTPFDSEMPVVTLDGYEYVGYVEIPVLKIKLPVMSSWDYDKLKVAPCRQFGSTRTDDLVIAAHNYEKHFGRLKELSKGDAVTFTDMEGIVNTYGSTIIPCRYNKIQQEGNIYYVTANGKKGIFNRYGSTIIPCQYDEIISLGHRYIVKRDKKFGVYNQYGSTILPCQFQKIECLNNGHYVTTRDKSQQVYNAYGALLENRTNMKVVFSTED